MAGEKFRGDIQGLRAIAVGSVVLYHAGIPFLPGGYVGVDIFFVISGFLITSHLLDGFARDGKVRFGQFYARRARRILPASFFILALTVVASFIWVPPLLRDQTLKDAIATALYVPNYLFAAQGTNYLAEATPSAFQHYWSLGIEEQFYLFWPAILAIGFLVFKTRKKLVWVVTGIVVLSFLACVVLTYRSQPWAFFSLPTRAWELGTGGLAAFVLGRSWALHPVPAAVAGWVGVAGLVGCIVLFTDGTLFPGYAAAGPVLATVLVIVGGASSSAWGPTRLLSARPMLFVGAISYSLYLLHWPALVIPQAAVGYFNPLPLWVTCGIAVFCVPLAWLMYRYVENPARRWRWLTQARSSRTLWLSAATSVLVVAVATTGIVATNAIPLHEDVAVAAAPVTDPPSETGFVPLNVAPTLMDVADDNPVLYDDDCHLDFTATDGEGCRFGSPDGPVIALYGDSHAAQWFPALIAFADANGYQIETHTKSSCPSLDVPVYRAGAPYTACTTWRANVLKHLEQNPPALVLLANYGKADLGVEGDDYETAWASGLKSTIHAVTDFAPVALMADTPDLGETPSICLSANLANAMNCARPASDALGSPVRKIETTIAGQMNVPTVDLTGFICGPDICPPVIGNTVVYRDAHHLTATFSAELSTPLGDALRPLLDRR